MSDTEEASAHATGRPEERERESSFPGKRMQEAVRDTLKRALEKGVEAGLGTLSKTDEALRGVVAEGKLPRELASMVFNQIEETKNGLVRGVAREVREFLEATDLASEIRKALTTLSFEIRTEIRFVPNEAGEVKPEIKATVTPRVTKRPSVPPPPPRPDGP